MTPDNNHTNPDPVARDSERWIELGWGDPTSMAAFMSVMRVHKQLVDRSHGVLSALSLSITEYAALVFLGLTPQHQQPLGKIAERLLVGVGRCSYVIDRLEHQGLVERRRSEEDRRTILATLTPKGHQCLEQANELLTAEKFGFGPIDDTELNAVVATLSSVRTVIGDSDDIVFDDEASSA